MALKKVAGVEDADVSYEEGRAIVTFDPEQTSPTEFINELEQLTGFTARVAGQADSTAAVTPIMEN